MAISGLERRHQSGHIRDAAKKIEAGAKAVIHSSCTVEVQEKENQKEENARKPV
jgi:hypothetical protein